MIGPTYPYRGGISHYNTLLAQELAKQGHQVECLNFTRMYPSLLFPGKTQLDESEEHIGVPSERVLDSLNPLSWRKTGLAAANASPDLAVYHWWHPFFAPSYRGVAASLRRHRRSTRQVFICHNVLPHESSPVDRGLARFAYAAPDAFVVHSTLEEKKLEALAPSKPVRVHPHPSYDVFAGRPLGRERARRELKLDGDVILFFGYVRPYKGLRYAIEALAEVRRRRPVMLVVAGEFYEPRSEYEALIDRLGLRDAVRVVDEYIPNEDVGAYFEAADLVVQPYVTATQSGISQIAFAFGKPVVATAVGGLPDIIDDGETGFLVPPEDSIAIATAIERFFDGDMAIPMRDAILSSRERFSWSSLARCLTNA